MPKTPYQVAIGAPVGVDDRMPVVPIPGRSQMFHSQLLEEPVFEADRIKVSHVGVKFHLGSINENEGWNEWNVLCPDWISSIRCWWSQVSTNLCLMKCPWPTPSWLNYWAYDKYDNGFKWLTPQMWLPNSENVQDPSRNWKNHSPKTSSWTAISGKRQKKTPIGSTMEYTIFQHRKDQISLPSGNLT